MTKAASHVYSVLFTYKHREEFQQLHAWTLEALKHNAAMGFEPADYEVIGGQVTRSALIGQKVAPAHEMVSAAEAKQAAAKSETAGLVAAAAGVKTEGPVFVGQSHESGRNATVTLWPDRIERVKAASFGSLSRAKQVVEVTPIRAVTSVQTKKDGFFTKVTVFASGNNIDFKFGHSEAAAFREAIQRLILAPAVVAAPVVMQQGPDLADQLMKLAALRDQGILSPDEFAAEKAKLLAR